MTLRELVAVRVMGRKIDGDDLWRDSDGSLWEAGGIVAFRPDEDIADAWRVVEKMHDHSHRIDVTFEPDRGVSKTWKVKGKTYIGTPDINPNPKPHYVCSIMGKSKKYAQCWEGGWSAKADTAPLAICIAALRAVGVPEAEIEEARKQ